MNIDDLKDRQRKNLIIVSNLKWFFLASGLENFYVVKTKVYLEFRRSDLWNSSFKIKNKYFFLKYTRWLFKVLLTERSLSEIWLPFIASIILFFIYLYYIFC